MIFKTAVASLFTLSGLASALAATHAYYIAEFQATDLDACSKIFGKDPR